MRLHIVSDLHLEFGPIELPEVDRDVLVLAGDIHVGKQAMNFLEEQTNLSKVIYVLGNHEFYHNEYYEVLEYWQSVEMENLIVLENEAVILQDCEFYGATLWTDFNEGSKESAKYASLRMNDFSEISMEDEELTPWDTYTLHKTTLDWLQPAVQNGSAEQKIVITHHLPSKSSAHEKYQGDPLNHAFYSDLDHIIEENELDMWIHGHTHESFDYTIGSTRVVCNPRGYTGVEENNAFDPGLVVDL